MRKNVVCYLVIVICVFTTACLAKYSGGTGDPNDPYLIATPNDLNSIGTDPNDWDKHYKMTADIDLSPYTGTQFNIIGNTTTRFTGVFDGNDHAIRNFTYNLNPPSGNYIGLFGHVDDPNAEIKNVTLIDPNVKGGYHVGSLVGEFVRGTINTCRVEGSTITGAGHVGGLVGYNSEGTISNCSAAGSVTINFYYAGGLVGSNQYGTISNCYAISTVAGNDNVGGLVGYLRSGIISDSYATGSVSVEDDYVGGLVGYNYDGTISKSYATTNVTAYDDYVGGLVGYDNYGTISNCYATGSVTGDTYVGGLGGCVHGNILHCYSTGSVSGSGYVGGFAGVAGHVLTSFWDTQTSGQDDGVGTGFKTGLEGKTTTEMQTMSTFFAWGSKPPIWTIDEGHDYPHLASESQTGEPILCLLEGSGTAQDPYLIYTDQQLNIVGLYIFTWDKHFRLMANIDLSGYTDTQFNIIGNDAIKFTGIFDGNGHVISNFNYSSSADFSNVGLFGRVSGQQSLIKNITLLNPQLTVPRVTHAAPLIGYLWESQVADCVVLGGFVKGSDVCGGLIGRSEQTAVVRRCSSSCDVSGWYGIGGLIGVSQGTVEDCMAEGNVLADSGQAGGLLGVNGADVTRCDAHGEVNTPGPYVGGFVGNNSGATILNSDCTGSVNGGKIVGGFAGSNSGDIINCSATGAANAYGSEPNYVGGFAGYNNKGKIESCWASGDVSGSFSVGGLVGRNAYYYYSTPSIIRYCYSLSQVTGQHTSVGGLVGTNEDSPSDSGGGQIFYSYSVGPVVALAGSAGGLVGLNKNIVTRCYWDTEASGQLTSDGGEGRTTEQMYEPGNYAGWECPEVWTIEPGMDYPHLYWENQPGDMLKSMDWQGSGTEDDPYRISTAEQMNFIGLVDCRWDAHFKLTADINLATLGEAPFNMIGRYGDSTGLPDSPFTGVFDGNGHTVSNLTVDVNDMDSVGLFRFVDDPCSQIVNVKLVDPCIMAAGKSHYTAALVGYMKNGIVERCSVIGGHINGYHDVGAIVGYCLLSDVNQCHAVCEIEGDNSVGGIAGTVRANSEIHASWFAGTISESAQAGGICGRNYGTIRNCYAEATLNNSQFVGGLVGRNWGLVFHCFSAGHVFDSNFVGGLVENNSGGMVMSSYWDISTSQIFTSSGGLPRTTEQLQDPNTFICWGSDPVWVIEVAVDYPRLWWEGTTGELLENAKYLAGSGTAESPYILETAEDLIKLSHARCDWDKHFKLLNDVNLSDIDLTSWMPIGNNMWPFTGVFDGNNKTISSLTYQDVQNQDVGLFGLIDDPCAHIFDLTLLDFDIEFRGFGVVGALVGFLKGGQISGCHAIDTQIHRSDVAGTLGGLVGRSEGGRISRCSTSVIATGGSETGGLVGVNDQGIVEYCTVRSTVMCYTGPSSAGGLVGLNDGGTIANCYSEGLVGASWNSGGLVGVNIEGWIQNCYSASKVGGDPDIGGLIARNVRGQVENSFWDIVISGQLTSEGGTGLPTEDMQLEQTFTSAGWDFNTPIWTIEETADYPRLWWEPNILPPKYAGGRGTIQNPYIIALPVQLQQLGQKPQDWHKHFRLISDIDLSAYNGQEGSEPFNIIGDLFGNLWVPFTGVFDGGGHTISNFTCYGINRERIGLFGYVSGSQARIRNIHMAEPNVSGELIGYVGSLVGYLDGAAVSNCSVDGGFVSSVGDGYTISNIGGLIGYSQMSTICDSYFAGEVSGYSEIGGLIGTIVQSTVSNNFAIGTVEDVGYDYYASGVGGLVGHNQDSTILRCFADCDVVGSYSVGGLVGFNEGDISDSYALGDVNGVSSVGGMAGSCWDKYYPVSLSHSYAAGRVVAEDIAGGLVGNGYTRDCYAACFWDANVNNDLTGIGNNYSDPCGVIGETTENMKLTGTYIDTGWDFVGRTKDTANRSWRLCENGIDYPWLAWQFTEYADFLCPDGVDFIDYAVLADQWYLERLEQDIVPEGGDGIVNLLDWAALAADWQGSVDFSTIADFLDNWLKQRPTIADIAPPGGDDFVDWLDLRKFCENWLYEK